MAESTTSSNDERPDSQRQPASNVSEDDRLARWVRAVVLRWTATGVSARDRTRLFAGLLHELVLARTSRTGLTQLVHVEPATFADRLAARRSDTPGPSTFPAPQGKADVGSSREHQGQVPSARHISRRKQKQRLPWT